MRHHEDFPGSADAGRTAGRLVLIGIAVAYLVMLLLLPLITVFAQAFAKGVLAYVRAIADAETLTSMRLTLEVAAISVPLNMLFGTASAWLIAKHDFRFKDFLLTLIDLPLVVSPVIAGMLFVLVFGARGWFGGWLSEHAIKVIFALPGMVLATTFVTIPFVARELIPLMQAQGREDEEAGLSLGAGGWRIFRVVTLPNVRWAMLYGVLICNARAMGEFGAVSVVSGHIRGATDTLPLHVEILYNEYNSVGAFATASLLAMLALVTLGLKSLLERRHPELRHVRPMATL
jgi:sulfate transport system permease protein